MLIRSIENGLKLHAEAFANGIIHLQAEGLDGLQNSLLNRYGFIHALEPDARAVAENDTLTTSGGISLKLNQNGTFELRKEGVLLAESLATGCVASAPTVFRNQGFRLEMKLRDQEKLIGFGDQVRTRLLLNGQHDQLYLKFLSGYRPLCRGKGVP